MHAGTESVASWVKECREGKSDTTTLRETSAEGERPLCGGDSDTING
jgi:hypothetical protein